jgi:hypothetical protein
VSHAISASAGARLPDAGADSAWEGGVVALRTTTTWWGVVLDTPDVPTLARFYADLLGWQIFNEDAEGAAVAKSEDAGYYISVQWEPLYVRPVWPAVDGQPQMSMHLDFEVEDLDAAVAHAVGVGATLAEHQPQDTVRVLLDPVGHPFCLYLDPTAPSSTKD